MTTAGDLMQAHVFSISPDASLLEVHRLFVEEEINGAPVIDEDGVLRGVVSSLDLLSAVKEAYETDAGGTTPIYYRDELPYSGPDWQRLPDDFQDRMAGLTAADAMVKEVITVSPKTPISEVAKLMRSQRIHRVLVVEDGAVCGLVSTFDLVGLLATRERGGARPQTEARRH